LSSRGLQDFMLPLYGELRIVYQIWLQRRPVNRRATFPAPTAAAAASGSCVGAQESFVRTPAAAADAAGLDTT